MLVDGGSIQVKVRLRERAGGEDPFSLLTETLRYRDVMNITHPSERRTRRQNLHSCVAVAVALHFASASAHLADKRQKLAQRTVCLANLKCHLVVLLCVFAG